MLVIGIDGGNIRGGGTVTHLVEVLRSVEPSELGIERVVVWGGSNLLDAIDDRPWLVKKNPNALNRGFINRSYWQSFALSEEARVEKCNILFVPGGAYVGSFRPVVVMSQNLIPFDLGEIRRYGISFNIFRLYLLRWVQSKAIKEAEGAIFLTNYSYEATLRTTGMLRGQSIIIPHGLSPRLLGLIKEQKLIREYSSSEPYRLLYVSTIDEYKHQWHVVKAVALLRREYGYSLDLELVGSAYPPSLARLRKTMKCFDPNSEWVHYRGVADYGELHQKYAAADLGVFASSCETFGIILLESMGAGLPIACSNRSSLPETLGEGGIYFDPEDPHDIARALRLLIESPELRTLKAVASYQSAQEFSWVECAKTTFGFLADTVRAYQNRELR